MGKSNSILSEFLLLFPSVLTSASRVGEGILAPDARTDTTSFCTLALCCGVRGRHYLTRHGQFSKQSDTAYGSPQKMQEKVEEILTL